MAPALFSYQTRPERADFTEEMTTYQDVIAELDAAAALAERAGAALLEAGG